MLCTDCEALAGAGHAGRLTHLVHVNASFFKSTDRKEAPLLDARTDTYLCKACDTLWEADFDPSAQPEYSAFRQIVGGRS
jgi:hypothetical protein